MSHSAAIVNTAKPSINSISISQTKAVSMTASVAVAD
jgi:hypothetical protein